MVDMDGQFEMASGELPSLPMTLDVFQDLYGSNRRKISSQYTKFRGLHKTMKEIFGKPTTMQVISGFLHISEGMGSQRLPVVQYKMENGTTITVRDDFSGLNVAFSLSEPMRDPPAGWITRRLESSKGYLFYDGFPEEYKFLQPYYDSDGVKFGLYIDNFDEFMEFLTEQFYVHKQSNDPRPLP